LRPYLKSNATSFAGGISPFLYWRAAPIRASLVAVLGKVTLTNANMMQTTNNMTMMSFFKQEITRVPS